MSLAIPPTSTTKPTLPVTEDNVSSSVVPSGPHEALTMGRAFPSSFKSRRSRMSATSMFVSMASLKVTVTTLPCKTADVTDGGVMSCTTVAMKVAVLPGKPPASVGVTEKTRLDPGVGFSEAFLYWKASTRASAWALESDPPLSPVKVIVVLTKSTATL